MNSKSYKNSNIIIFSSELASLFIDSGAGLVLSIWFVLAVVHIEQQKQIYRCSYNEQTNR